MNPLFGHLTVELKPKRFIGSLTRVVALAQLAAIQKAADNLLPHQSFRDALVAPTPRACVAYAYHRMVQICWNYRPVAFRLRHLRPARFITVIRETSDRFRIFETGGGQPTQEIGPVTISRALDNKLTADFSQLGWPLPMWDLSGHLPTVAEQQRNVAGHNEFSLAHDTVTDTSFCAVLETWLRQQDLVIKTSPHEFDIPTETAYAVLYHLARLMDISGTLQLRVIANPPAEVDLASVLRTRVANRQLELAACVDRFVTDQSHNQQYLQRCLQELNTEQDLLFNTMGELGEIRARYQQLTAAIEERQRQIALSVAF